MRTGPHTATLKFAGALADFITPRGDGLPVGQVNFRLHPSAKDLIESQGVPHVAIYALRVNNQFRTLEYNVQNGDELVVYPKSEADSLSEEKLIKNPKQLLHTFIADVHLGKLARLLRLLGVDVAYANGMDDTEIIEKKAVSEDRALLTRDLELLKHGSLQHGYWPRSTDPEQQVKEVLDYYELEDQLHPFTRCMSCNGFLKQADNGAIWEKVPPKVKQWCDEYWQCTNCEKIYWKGSHYEQLLEKINRIRA